MKDEEAIALAEERQFNSARGRRFIIEQAAKLDPQNDRGYTLDAMIIITQARHVLKLREDAQMDALPGEIGELLRDIADRVWASTPRGVLVMVARCRAYLASA